MGSLDPKGRKQIGMAGSQRGKYLEQTMLGGNSRSSLEPSLGRLDLNSWAGEAASVETISLQPSTSWAPAKPNLMPLL